MCAALLTVSLLLFQTPPPPPQSPLADAPAEEPTKGRRGLEALPREVPVAALEPHRRTAAPWVLSGLALAMGVGSGACLVAAGDAATAYAQSSPETNPLVRDELLRRREQFATAGMILLGTAAVLAVTSLVLFICEAR